jgi:hypothetical protein
LWEDSTELFTQLEFDENSNAEALYEFNRTFANVDAPISKTLVGLKKVSFSGFIKLLSSFKSNNKKLKGIEEIFYFFLARVKEIYIQHSKSESM